MSVSGRLLYRSDFHCDRDIGSYVRDAQKMVEETITLPPGYSLQWSGQYEAAETGVVMLIYLDHAWKARQDESRRSARDLYDAIMEGAVERVRPKMMTVTAIIGGLLPILWGTGTGASVMKRIAAPMVGGMVSSTVLTLVVIPAIYSLWQEYVLTRRSALAQSDVRSARGLVSTDRGVPA